MNAKHNADQTAKARALLTAAGLKATPLGIRHARKPDVRASLIIDTGKLLRFMSPADLVSVFCLSLQLAEPRLEEQMQDDMHWLRGIVVRRKPARRKRSK